MRIFNKKRIIRLEQQSQSANLMQWLLLLPFGFGVLIELLPFPNAVKYICDLLWVSLLVLLLRQRWVITRAYSLLCGWVLLFLLYTAITYVAFWQSPLYYLWGLRNNFRYYAAFLGFGYFLKEKQIEKLFRMLDCLFWVNFLISLVQYYGFGIAGDHLGGLFGAKQGCNGYSVIFFAVVIVRSVVFCLEGKEAVSKCILKCTAALYLSVLAELKFFFAAFVVIVALAVLMTNYSWRKLVLVLGSAIGVAVCTAWMAKLFSDGSRWFSLKWMWDVVTSDRGYTSSGDLNRLTAIGQINELWLKEWPQRLFGMGLGNCDASSFSVVNTPFYREHGDMHYTWMSYALMYLETGYIGLVFYWGFFALTCLCARRIEKRSAGMARSYCRVSRIIAVLCTVISVYNSSLRTEAGYMVYFVLAVPFALGRTGTDGRSDGNDRACNVRTAENV